MIPDVLAFVGPALVVVGGGVGVLASIFTAPVLFTIAAAGTIMYGVYATAQEIRNRGNTPDARLNRAAEAIEALGRQADDLEVARIATELSTVNLIAAQTATVAEGMARLVDGTVPAKVMGPLLAVRAELLHQNHLRFTENVSTGGRVTQERAERAAADAWIVHQYVPQAVQGPVANEAATRAAVDSQLAHNLNTEAVTRGSADSLLNSQIHAEATIRDAADKFIVGQAIPAAVNQVSAKVDVNTAAIAATAAVATAASVGVSTLTKCVPVCGSPVSNALRDLSEDAAGILANLAPLIFASAAVPGVKEALGKIVGSVPRLATAAATVWRD